MLFRKKTYTSGKSLSAHAWRQFKRNKLAFSALIFTILVSLVAVAGYLITPDHTPMANDQHLELAAQKPGFTVDMLKIRRNMEIESPNFFQWMFYGKADKFREIPISSMEIVDGMVLISEYSPTKTSSELLTSFSLADVLYAINTDKEISVDGQMMIFEDIHGEIISASIAEMEDKVLDDHIVKKRFLLGSDRYGRDLLSRLMIGARISLSVGFIAVLISLIIGISLGAMAGFFRGWIDNLIVWIINVVWSIPTLLLVIAITFALGKGFWQVFIAVGLTMWVEVARVVRGQILSIREKEFVEAGRALGFKNFRIIFRHVLPNIMGPVIVISAANFAAAILIEAGLSFLGIGVQPPMPSWGTMIKENYAYIILDAAYLAILPGIAIMLMVLAFMIIGNGLRDALDVKST